MNSVTAIASVIFAIVFVWVIAAAIISLWKAPLRDPDAPLANRKKKKKRRGPQNHAVPAPPRRGRRLRRNQRATLLPSDATINFAEERQGADIDEVFTALDDDLIGLVPIKTT
jgi:hypothetical protein